MTGYAVRHHYRELCVQSIILSSSPTPTFFPLIAPGLPAALVALLVAIIAWRQYKVAKAKLNLDLFERRYQIFHRTWTLMSEIAKHGPKVHEMHNFSNPFSNDMPEAAFLFGPKVEQYLSNAVTQWSRFRSVDMDLDAAKNAEERTRLEAWFFQEASVGCKKIFGEYLNFERWK